MSAPSLDQIKTHAAKLAGSAKLASIDQKALHPYCAEDGTPLYWRIRLKCNSTGEKFIRPFYWNGAAFENSEPPAPPEGKPLYGLERLTASPDALVIVTEGESCADALNKAFLKGQADMVAITSGGAQSAGTANWQPLADRRVIVWPDNDEQGAKYAADVVERLQGIAASVAVLDISTLNLPTKGDAADWIADGGNLGVLMKLIDAAKQPESIGGDSSPSDAGGDTWPAPQPLTAQIEAESYPLDALPDTIRAAVEEVIGFVKAPIPLAASSAIAAVSLASQALFDVERASNLHSPVSVSMLTIASSGERKSTCDGFFTRAIRDYETAQGEAAKPALKNYRAALEIWEAKCSGIKDKIRQEAKGGKATTQLERELSDLTHNEPEPPRVPRLIYGDVTPEELAYKLAKVWPSGGVISAEAGVVFGSHGMGKDSVTRNLARLNILWDGGDLQIDRRTTESFTVRGGRLTMGLQVQEETLTSFLDKSGALARGTGFLARFLVAWPESTQGARPFTEAPENWPCLAAFNRRITEILNQPVPIDDDGTLTPQTLTLTPEAKKLWIEYHDAIESELASGGELYDVKDVASKSADNATRLAALFHVFEGGLGAISADAFERGSQVAIWHLSESRRFFGELALPAEMADAVRFDKWLIEYCRREHTHYVGRRTAQRSGSVRDGGRLDAAISELVSLDRIQMRKEGKQLSIWINPALLGGAS